MMLQRVTNYIPNHFASIIRRLICWGTCFALILSSSPTLPAVIGKSIEKSNVYLTKGAPGRNLPNLDNARHMTSVVPKMLSQVSITKPSSRKINTTVNLLSSLISPSFIGVGAAGSALLAINDWFGSNDAHVKKKEPVKTIPSATRVAQSVSSVAGQSEDDGWEMALLHPKNRVGTGGEDLLSRNFNWGLPLVALPGRAGMDLNLGLAYNSLVWTKAQGNIHFDLDKGFPSPGFHLGLPELGTAFFNSETSDGSMLVTMPSGQRLEFRRNSSLGTYKYEEQTGTNMLLVITLGLTGYKSNIWRILTPDGTTYTFKVITSSPKCTEIKDRNGNYISIGYTTSEKISTITDTLSRIVNFNYDSNNLLTSITQNWSGVTHTYATFAYSNVTISAGYLSLNMIGAQNGQTIPVLSQIGLADGSVHAFEYNTYAQVHTIRRYAPNSSNPSSFPGDYTQLSYVTYDLPRDAMGEQIDCPRFSTRTDWAKDWNNNNGVTTTFHGDFNSFGRVTTPDQVIYEEVFGTSGWQRGLTTKTETWHDSVKKKWTEAIWENGNASASYQINPRIIETNIYDEQGNRKKTTMTYTDYNSVSDIKEYSNATDVYRHTHIDYERGSAYIDNKNRRMTNLVKSQTVFDGSGVLFDKATYEYDLGGDYLVHQGPPIRHDTTKYGATFVQGRGNVNVVRQWDITDSISIDKTLISKTGYNTSGSVIYTEDGLGHRSNLKYDDSFSDSQNRNTYAYVTEAKDPDGYASIVKYNFDFGAATRTQNPKGAATVYTFDILGRLERITNEVNQAYTGYVYATNQLSVQTYTTINDLNSELYSIKIVDGYGRVRAAASGHPNSIGGMRGQYFEYNNLGQQVRQTNPTEIDVNWNPVGDDVAGFAWRGQQYDWKGRPTVSVNQDSTTKTVSYESCGCTGVNTITYTDEMGRRQKEFSDSFGRKTKSQILNFDGSIYSTVSYNYNVRNQRLREFHQIGENGEGQETLITYDGYGRVYTSKKPIEASPTNYTYNADNTLHTKTDARSVITTYEYNNRKLVTSISYNNVSGVSTTGAVTYGYNSVGNRIWMDDAPGRVDYVYNDQSQLTSETRQIDGLGSYAFTYIYSLDGKLKTVTDHTGTSFSYEFDHAGRIVSVNGSGINSLPQYTKNYRYRAWDEIKHIEFNNNVTVDKNFNSRLLTTKTQLNNISDGRSDSTQIMGYDFDYYSDGRIRFTKDLNNKTFDRLYSYDNIGRISEAKSGKEARGEPLDTGDAIDSGHIVLGAAEIYDRAKNVPYKQSMTYDEFGNLRGRVGYTWSHAVKDNASFNPLNNKRSNSTYDNSGNEIKNPHTVIFDSAGDSIKSINANTVGNPNGPSESLVSANETETIYSGDRETIKTINTHRSNTYNTENQWTGVETHVTSSYYLRSSILNGAVIAEIIKNDQAEADYKGYVYSQGKKIASNFRGGHQGAGLLSTYFYYPGETGSWIEKENWGGAHVSRREVDPIGVDVGSSDPAPPKVNVDQDRDLPLFYFNRIDNSNPYDWRGGCRLDGQPVSCSELNRMLDNGTAEVIKVDDRGKRIPADIKYIGGVGGGMIKVDPPSSSVSGGITEGFILDKDGNVVAEVKFAEASIVKSETHFINVIEGMQIGNLNQGTQYERWVILNLVKLRAKAATLDSNGRIIGDWDPYKPEGKKRECAALPQLWDWDQGRDINKLNVEVDGKQNWHKGEPITLENFKKLKPGAVFANFNPLTGKYDNKKNGNHVFIYDGYYDRDGRKGVYVIDQGPNNWIPLKHILYFDGKNYYDNPANFNTVMLPVGSCDIRRR